MLIPHKDETFTMATTPSFICHGEKRKSQKQQQQHHSQSVDRFIETGCKQRTLHQTKSIEHVHLQFCSNPEKEFILNLNEQSIYSFKHPITQKNWLLRTSVVMSGMFVFNLNSCIIQLIVDVNCCMKIITKDGQLRILDEKLLHEENQEQNPMICSICFDQQKEYCLRCGHSFCGDCLKSSQRCRVELPDSNCQFDVVKCYLCKSYCTFSKQF